jgi:hypothetical protein
METCEYCGQTNLTGKECNCAASKTAQKLENLFPPREYENVLPFLRKAAESCLEELLSVQIQIDDVTQVKIERCGATIKVLRKDTNKSTETIY